MADDLIEKALRAACPSARPAGSGDVVAGVPARYVAEPASVDEAGALLRAACEHGLAMVPRGSGSKLGWAAPPRRCDLVIDTSGLDRVIEHAAGDLVARVQAGVSLARLAEVLAGAGQYLALDPPEGGTVGGVLATGAAGPRRLHYGTPRDLVIGMTVVRADGTVARSGGKVVKNVAGYDLGKLFAGSYGTLGLIAEAVVRLHPRPGAATYTVAECADPAAAHRMTGAVAGSQLAPTAIEVERPGRGRPVRVGVLLEGDPAGVQDRSTSLATLLGSGARSEPAQPSWWGGVGSAAPVGGTQIRLAFWAGALTDAFAVIDAAASAAGLDPAVGGSAAAGILDVAVGPDAEPGAVAAFVSHLRAALARGDADARAGGAPRASLPAVLASAVVRQAPQAVRDLIDLWGPVPSLPLMRAIKDQFDPGHLMAPGRFAGGI